MPYIDMKVEVPKTNFSDLVKNIAGNYILLPDFQRDFTWIDESEQKRLVASVLANMPIGGVLLLESKADEYLSTFIGSDIIVDTSNLKDVKFLLDGQQRITVLANVFSSIIHENCEVSALKAPKALKRRFFLKIPKWESCTDRDLLGVKELAFRYGKSSENNDMFLSGDILPHIECVPFTARDKKPYNPKSKLDTSLDDFCMNYKESYLIPLYLLINSVKDTTAKLRFKYITEKIARGVASEIMTHLFDLNSDAEKKTFLSTYIEDDMEIEEILHDNFLFENYINDRADSWMEDIKDYLRLCIAEMNLGLTKVPENQRERAIDIYENFNRGGVSLNTFDLITARVAKVDRNNYYGRIKNNIKEDKVYEFDVPVIPDRIQSGYSVLKKYNASMQMECLKNERSSRSVPKTYIDAYLNVMSLYSNNADLNADFIKLDHIKKGSILNVLPEDLRDNCDIVCTALDRAMFFFQTRCGIRNINEINYALMIVLVATLFIKDEWFYDKEKHEILEAWYWSVIFSGHYDKDQNSRMKDDLVRMIKTFEGSLDKRWISDTYGQYVLNEDNYSGKDMLLMKKVNEGRIPKNSIRNFICQFLLSKTYIDMFEKDKRISVFSEDAKNLEAHHIVPLGEVTKVGESTAELRNKSEHICNSPLNYCYITKESNKEISDDSLDVYISKIRNEAKTSLHIVGFNGKSDIDKADKIECILNERFDRLQGDIKDHISKLLS